MVAAYELWSIPGCMACDDVKEKLEKAGARFEVKDLGSVVRGDVKDVDVITQLAMQNNAAPVLILQRADTRVAIEPAEIDTFLMHVRDEAVA